ncbi:hypothetical protein BTA51_08575 [Hahella sp. CCB-MM4]|uniref:RodZ domain-containing protein n=1 Tax=Hahella sp. (strain CCB-MM4) TaxID=1926491 RepID=UPI000B9A9A89|nr:RodZ domain-containing protein [Hahella sp. CCB-MM4]OZG73840.1 hypothetical protein BTA51_08575 [Hahella sp. CCB-MM4]
MSSENAVPQKTNNRPGSRLKRAREDRGWSIPETAEKLHVIPRYVRAIEDGDYGQLPGLVFLKGYVRSYARLVSLSEDRLIEDLEQELLMSSDPMIEPSGAATSPAGFSESADKGGRKWAVLLILVVLAGIGYFGWQNFNESLKGETDAPLATETTGSSDGSAFESDAEIKPEPETAPSDQSALNIPPEEATIESEGKVQPEAEVAGDSEVAVDETDLTSNTGVTSNSAEIESQPAVVEEQSPAISEADFTESRVSSAADDSVTDPARVAIKAVFSGDCWFDLRDRDNSRTVGLYRSGDVVDFTGFYPLRFVVGAVNAVSIDVNGEPLDFSRYKVRNNRVELVLEQ